MVAVMLAKFSCIGWSNHVRVDRTQVIPGAGGRIEQVATLFVIRKRAACRGEARHGFLRHAFAKEIDDSRGEEERGNSAEDSTYDGSHVRMRACRAGQVCIQ